MAYVRDLEDGITYKSLNDFINELRQNIISNKKFDTHIVIFKGKINKRTGNTEEVFVIADNEDSIQRCNEELQLEQYRILHKISKNRKTTYPFCCTGIICIANGRLFTKCINNKDNDTRYRLLKAI